MCSAVFPESYLGGPLALVQDGDAISLDIQNRKLALLVSEAEVERRRSEWKRQIPKDQRGYLALYREHVTQANQGCDFDFLPHVPEQESNSKAKSNRSLVPGAGFDPSRPG